MLWVWDRQDIGRQAGDSQGGGMGKGEGRRSIGISSRDCSGSLHAHSKGDVDRAGEETDTFLYVGVCVCVQITNDMIYLVDAVGNIQ